MALKRVFVVVALSHSLCELVHPFNGSLPVFVYQLTFSLLHLIRPNFVAIWL